MTYRVFIGLWEDDEDHDWVATDIRGLSWEDARSRLSDHLSGYLNDDWEFVRKDAEDELEKLRYATPGRFEADVDGTDYLIIPE